MAIEIGPPPEGGWTYVASSTKVHYFHGDDSRSLCGRYGNFMIPTERYSEEDGVPTDADCVACRRKLDDPRNFPLKKESA